MSSAEEKEGSEEGEKDPLNVAFHILTDAYALHEKFQLRGVVLKRVENGYWGIYADGELVDIVALSEKFHSARNLLKYLDRAKRADHPSTGHDEEREIISERGVQ